MMRKFIATLLLAVTMVLGVGSVVSADAGRDCPSGYVEVDAGNGLVLCVDARNIW